MNSTCENDGPDLSGIEIPKGDRFGNPYEQLCAAWHREPVGDTLAAIGAAILALRHLYDPAQGRAWPPIATAPRDGRTMLIRFSSDGPVSQAKYIEGLPYPWKFLDTNDGVLWQISYAKEGPGGPTEWMSLTGPTIERAAAAEPGEAELRAEFARQHEGRDLTQHRLRGTYIRGDIAALWNQHRRTAKWMARRALTGLQP